MTSHIASLARIARAISAACIASTVAVAASFAQVPTNDRGMRSVTVKYEDLDLATEEGSHALYGRLTVAAREVCPQIGDTLLALRQNRDAQRCITDTVQRAVKGIKNPKFADVAASRLR
jgi:UrcA family protein